MDAPEAFHFRIVFPGEARLFLKISAPAFLHKCAGAMFPKRSKEGSSLFTMFTISLSPSRAFMGLFFLFFSVLSLTAQSHHMLEGAVFDEDNYPLAGATVSWEDGSGTTCDVEGKFSLHQDGSHTRFTVSYLGFESRTFLLDTLVFPLRIVLQEGGNTLMEVQVTARDKGSYTSTLSGRNIESLTSKELRKAPCCTLAESFENSPVVDLTYGDPLTGRREIQMLGLRGNYTLLTLEKRPALTGLATPYALDMIPGTWVSGIQLGKGSGSVESGAAGLTGQINTELHSPKSDVPFFVNLFAGSQGRGEANVHFNQEIDEVLSHGLYLHGSFTENKHDRDFDSFKDMPDRRTGAALYRFLRSGKGNWEGQWNVLATYDRREAGQDAVHNHGQATLDPYRITQNNEHLEVFGKTGFFGFEKPHQSLGFIYSGSYHRLNNRYGRKQHLGEQQSLYFSSLYHTQIVDDRHQLAMGINLQYDRFEESLADARFDRTENTLGAYGEYTFLWEQFKADRPYRAFTAIASLRADRHNLGGFQASPRLNLKYNFSENNAVRLSAGRGWRSPNVLVENLNWLPSSRQLALPSATDASNPGFSGLETAWNFGANFTQGFEINGRSGQFLVDYFHTNFQNQIVVDVEQNLSQLLLYQLDGASFANSVMLSLSHEILPLIDVKLAYKYNDVRTTYQTKGLRTMPLIPRHRVLTTLDYDGSRFRANLNFQWVGTQRLPDHDLIPEEVFLPHPQIAPSFGLLGGQITYVANAKTEIYFGGENLTNVTQRNAIIGAQEPFDGPYFDAAQVYQPLFGRIFFVGLRYAVR